MVQTALNLTCKLDESNNILSVSGCSAELLGYSPNQLVGRNLLTLFNGETARQIKKKLVAPDPHVLVGEGLHKKGYSVSLKMMTWQENGKSFISLEDYSQQEAINQALTRKIKLQDLTADISCRLLSAKGDEIDRIANEALKKLGKVLGCKRAWLFLLGRDRLSRGYEWHSDDLSPALDIVMELETKNVGWWLEQIKEMRTIRLKHISELPQEAEVEYKTLKKIGIESLLTVPISYTERSAGFIGVENPEYNVLWDTSVESSMLTIGSAIIASKRLDSEREKNRKNQIRLQYALEASGAAVWDVNTITGEMFFSPAHKNLLGYEPDKLPKTLKGWIRNYIHPKDWLNIKTETAKLGKEKPLYLAVYRARHKNGNWIVIESIGKVVEWLDKSAARIVGTHRDITAKALLEQTIIAKGNYEGIIGQSKAIAGVIFQIEKAAQSDSSVVIYGESGTGKELVARAMHNKSRRSDGPFIAVNCAAVPEHLIESEFFGYKKGAFTGADKDKRGYIDAASGGVLFLDEVAELPLMIQAKLLRVLESGTYIPVGATRERRADFRVIAATNKDMPELVKQGKIREDFFYRIHVISLHMPPLRERKEDIPLLVYHFVKKLGHDLSEISPNIMALLVAYDWPGNVRELQNTLGHYLAVGQLDSRLRNTTVENKNKDEGIKEKVQRYEKQLIAEALKMNNWTIKKAAQALKMPRKTLYRKMKLYGIEKRVILTQNQKHNVA